MKHTIVELKSHQSGIRKLLFVLMFFCLLAGLAHAAPPVEDCSVSTDVYERLKCRETGLYKQMEELNLHLQNDDVFAETVKGKKKDAAEDIKSRAQKANERSKKDHFKKQIKKARKAGNDSCYFIELDDGLGNDDGICDLDDDEICAAETDINEKCDPRAKKDRPNQGVYVCAERCEGESVPSTDVEKEQEEVMAKELEKTYLVFEEQTKEMNENIEAIDSSSQPIARMSLLGASGDEGCGGNVDDTACNLSPSTALITLEHSKYTSQVAFSVARGAEDVLLTVCGTSIFGNNTSFLCTIPEGLVALFAIANEGIDVAYNILKEGQNDKVTNCLISKLNGIPTGGDLEEGFAASQAAIKADTQSIINTHEINMKNKIDKHNSNIETKIKTSETNLSTQIENLKVAMDKHALEIETLLNMPQGQRPTFPNK